jgi:hypothetical protein
MLLQGATAGDLQVTVQVAFPASAPAATQAGELLYLDDGDWLALGVSRSGAASFCPVAWEHAFPCQSATLPHASAFGRGMYLRIERQGSVFTGLISADGVGWTLVGSWRPVWPGAPSTGTATPTAATPSPTTSSVSPAPALAASQDVAPLAFTSIGLYAQNPPGGAPPASAGSTVGSASGWPAFLSFNVAALGAASSAVH